MNPWVITKDKLADPDSKQGTLANAVGVTGPYGYKGDGKELTSRFRMKDDDGEVYYYGFSREAGFEPLDDFGMPNAGCTTIEYFLNGDWEQI